MATPAPTTYEATLHTPLFYSSSEGRIIETDTILSSTALMHALGYAEFDLEKRYALVGDEATTPDYGHLISLPFVASDMRPIAVQADERTLRSVTYTFEYNITTTDEAVAQQVTGDDAIPKRAATSRSSWHKLRNYTGLEPGSTFEFTVWTEASLPEELRFRMGIRRSGELTAQRTDPADSVIVNKFLLESTYDLDQELLTALVEQAEAFRRGNDPRLQYFVGVDREWFEAECLPALL